MPETISPVTREEDYLAAIAGQDVTPPTPVTRKEEWLDLIADKVDDLAGDLSTAEGEIDDLQDIVPTPAEVDSGKVLTAGADGTASWKTPSGGGLQAFTIYATGAAQENSGNILVPTNLTSQVASTLFDSDTGRQLVPAFIAMPEFSGTSPYYTYENGTKFYLETELGSTQHDVGSYNVGVSFNPGTGDAYLNAMHK